MNKKFLKSMAAASCAALMATQAMAMTVSAVEYYYYYNNIYYSSPMEAAEAAGGRHSAYVTVTSNGIPSTAVKKYYDPVTNKIYDSEDAIVSAGVTNYDIIYVGSGTSPVYSYYNGYGYYSSYTHQYYSTYDAALRASNGISSYVTYVGNGYYGYYNGYYNGYYGYYSSYTHQYYSTYDAALKASNGNSSYVTYVGDRYYDGYYGYGYYSSYTHRYYSTYSEALKASNGISSYVTYVGDRYYDGYYGYGYGYGYYLYTGHGSGNIYRYYYKGVAYPSLDDAVKAGGTVGVDIYYSVYGSSGDVGYYYYYNGQYYGTLEAAKKAGGTELGVDISYVPYNYYGSTTLRGFYDPYGRVATNIFSNSDKIGTKKAEAGEPYLYGKNNRAGWTIINKIIEKTSKGGTVKIDMNGSSVIDKSLLSTIKGKNVNVTFVLDNGVKWTINGRNVSDASSDMVIRTEYNLDFIPKNLVKKAGKDSVSCSQIGISNNYDKFGADASVTVRFPAKRADCTATIYRYDPNSNALKGVDKAKVLSDGSCTFSIDAAGPYLIVLK